MQLELVFLCKVNDTTRTLIHRIDFCLFCTDDNMVTSTPHSKASTKQSSAKKKDKETWRDKPSCSTWKDVPSQTDRQSNSRDKQATKDLDNKENNSPPR